jgi:hypothetical protein
LVKELMQIVAAQSNIVAAQSKTIDTVTKTLTTLISGQQSAVTNPHGESSAVTQPPQHDSPSPAADADPVEDDIQQIYAPKAHTTREDSDSDGGDGRPDLYMAHMIHVIREPPPHDDSESEDEAIQERLHTAYMANVSKRDSGVAAGTVSIDREDPRIRRVITLLPEEFRAQGLRAITTEIETLVDLEVFE